MDEDVYYRIEKEGTGLYKEKMSRFLSFALKIENAEEAKQFVKMYQNEYHDSRHVCWAFLIGPKGEEWQLNDNGEPSGTAGKPILGQIRSFGVTDVLVIVVRYFGGIKLGTPGLIAAYREAAREALENSGKKECYETEEITIEFSYISADGVMKLVKSKEIEVKERQFDNVCKMVIVVRKSEADEIRGKLKKVEGVQILA
ncbi:MAG: YigZ family protein [Muribaculaceae bacterium]|nr:YigZ family protein [Muribaculaceae bacterium]